MTEVWKDIKGYEGYYQVSSHGGVRSLDRRVNSKNGSTQMSRGRSLRQSQRKSGEGYLAVSLCRHGTQKTYSVHRLVCEAFHGPNPRGMQVSHADDVPSNNRASNLSWATCQENIEIRDSNAGPPRGESNGGSKLTETCVHLIIALSASGHYRQRQIADMFNIGRSTVSAIARGDIWKHVPRPM